MKENAGETSEIADQMRVDKEEGEIQPGEDQILNKRRVRWSL